MFAKLTAKTIIASSTSRIILTDWRYPNEYDIIRAMIPGALITTVHILRQDHCGISPVIDVSEYYLKDHTPDWTVHNDGRRSLFKEAQDILKAI